MVNGIMVFSLMLGLAYLAVMAVYLHGWRQTPEWCVPDGFIPRTLISVVVPARNEAERIGACLRSIAACEYPADLLEVWVVDDFSTDETAALVQQFAGSEAMNLQLLRLNGTDAHYGKKRAIGAAIARATGELIATTDADCRVPTDWLRLLAFAYETRRPKAIAGPVVIDGAHNMLQRFQALDVAGLMGITGAGIRLGWQHMGNGANLAYPKAVFEAVGGFAGSEHRASGDDLFLLQKIAGRWPGGVVFLKNPAAVRTAAEPDWRSFFQQRLRWGTKNAALPETPVKLVLALVWMFCWSIPVSLLLGIGTPALTWLPVVLIALKAAADYWLLRTMCVFFNRRKLLRWFWPSFFLHIAYIAGMGTASLVLKRYVWKERACE